MSLFMISLKAMKFSSAVKEIIGLKKAEALPFGFLRRKAVEHSAQSSPSYQMEVPLLPVFHGYCSCSSCSSPSCRSCDPSCLGASVDLTTYLCASDLEGHSPPAYHTDLFIYLLFRSRLSTSCIDHCLCQLKDKSTEHRHCFLPWFWQWQQCCVYSS